MHYFEIDFAQGHRLDVWGLNVARTHSHRIYNHRQEMSSVGCARRRRRREGPDLHVHKAFLNAQWPLIIWMLDHYSFIT